MSRFHCDHRMKFTVYFELTVIIGSTFSRFLWETGEDELQIEMQLHLSRTRVHALSQGNRDI